MTDEATAVLPAPLLPPVPPAGAGLEPTLALALGLSVSPGVYAMLLGSGISRAAKIPTGWEVVLDLIRRVAAMRGQAELAEPDPEAWWAAQGHDEPRYDTLLEALAPSVAARRDLLHNYFEPTTGEEREQGIKQPTAAHRAFADLVAGGSVRLVLTTNFDRLMERALYDVGVSPQVVSRPDDIAGMAPLQHARATVVKLHGDYLDVEAIRNTPTELSSYDPAMRAFLDRILDEYGLLAVGWSGEWDTALVHAIQSMPARRYPMYWTAHRGIVTEPAGRLVATRAGHVIPVDSADAFAVDLRDKVSALRQMADPPPTRAVAVSTLKRNLQQPDRRIELFDQVNLQTNRTLDRLTEQRYPAVPPDGAGADPDALAAELHRQLEQCDTDTDVLVTLVAVAVYHGNPGSDNTVLRALRRLAERPAGAGASATGQHSAGQHTGQPGTGQPATGAHRTVLDRARLYPALRLATVAGVACVAARREDLLINMLVKTSVPVADSHGERTLVDLLHARNVLAPEVCRRMPRDTGTGHAWPWSRVLRTACLGPLTEVCDEREYAAAFSRYEFLRSMIEFDRGLYPALGEFAGVLRVDPDAWPAGAVLAEIDDRWPLLVAGGFAGTVVEAKRVHADVVTEARSATTPT